LNTQLYGDQFSPKVASIGTNFFATWTSMGQEAEEVERKKELAPFQVNAALMKHAPESTIFLHCLPARRGEEKVWTRPLGETADAERCADYFARQVRYDPDVWVVEIEDREGRSFVDEPIV
jgi:hypothetical protein